MWLLGYINCFRNLTDDTDCDFRIPDLPESIENSYLEESDDELHVAEIIITEDFLAKNVI